MIAISKYLNKYHKNLDSEISVMQENLLKISSKTYSINELMGYEGISANSYWSAIAKVIDYKFSFNSRNTKGASDIVNSSLNYAYAILYSVILKAIVAAGLCPNVSYLHSIDGQKPTLTFDLIEEFRAFIVDRTIISMINKNETFNIKNGNLDEETRKNISKNISEKLFTYTHYRGQDLKIQDIIQKQVYALRDYILLDSKYKPFIGRFQ